ncbi:MAG: hypothetical protein IJ581_00710 [Paludibacteraceae bacterium]|nr:hypothetical protein [Paludibacteraceae bacterium]
MSFLDRLLNRHKPARRFLVWMMFDIPAERAELRTQIDEWLQQFHAAECTPAGVRFVYPFRDYATLRTEDANIEAAVRLLRDQLGELGVDAAHGDRIYAILSTMDDNRYLAWHGWLLGKRKQ